MVFTDKNTYHIKGYSLSPVQFLPLWTFPRCIFFMPHCYWLIICLLCYWISINLDCYWASTNLQRCWHNTFFRALTHPLQISSIYYYRYLFCELEWLVRRECPELIGTPPAVSCPSLHPASIGWSAHPPYYHPTPSSRPHSVFPPSRKWWSYL